MHQVKERERILSGGYADRNMIPFIDQRVSIDTAPQDAQHFLKFHKPP